MNLTIPTDLDKEVEQPTDWEAQDRMEAVEGIKRGIEAFVQGRFRRFSEFEAEQRVKYSLPNALCPNKTLDLPFTEQLHPMAGSV